MLTELSLKNFKSWRAIDKMRLAPITGLFGTNSSGKTSILQWLLMLKQTAESSDRKQVLNLGDDRSLVDLGSHLDIGFRRYSKTFMMPDKRPPVELEWSLRWNGFGNLEISDPSSGPKKTLFEGSELKYECLLRERLPDRPLGMGQLSVESLKYTFADTEFALNRTKTEDEYDLEAKGSAGFHFKRRRGRVWPLPAPIKCYGFPDQVSGYFRNASFLADFQLKLEQQLAKVFYLGPLREYPHRQYTWSGAEPEDVGHRGEQVVPAILASRESGKTISRGKGQSRYSVEQYAAHWLEELGLIYSFSVRSVRRGSKLYEVVVRRGPEAPRVQITDVGFGVSQVLPVLVLCYYVPEGSTVILEQPEIHLHPKVQSGLADVIIDAVRVRGIQVIVESHSEHFLRRLQRRIAEGKRLQPDDVALYFCDSKGAESKLEPLDVDAFGNITNWPEDFFGDEVGEIAAMTEAAMKRRQQERMG